MFHPNVSNTPADIQLYLHCKCIVYRLAVIAIVVVYPARALRALGLLLADGAPTVGGGKTF